jgi:hypothetical protein
MNTGTKRSRETPSDLAFQNISGISLKLKMPALISESFCEHFSPCPSHRAVPSVPWQVGVLWSPLRRPKPPVRWAETPNGHRLLGLVLLPLGRGGGPNLACLAVRAALPPTGRLSVRQQWILAKFNSTQQISPVPGFKLKSLLLFSANP